MLPAKTERKAENKTECLCPLQRSVLPAQAQTGTLLLLQTRFTLMNS
jgi:hypothetical protein